MKHLKVILLVITLLSSTMFIGCSQKTEGPTNTITKDEYNKELKSAITDIFEKDSYTNKDEVLAFRKDMKNKATKDTESNQWYYKDQAYLFTIKAMYQELGIKIAELDCSDESISDIHKILVSQIEDIIEVSSVLLKYYGENTDIKSLNSSIPKIKLIFTENPNEYKVTEIVKNELEGRITRINGFVEGIIGVEVKGVPNDDLIDSSSVNNEKNKSVDTSSKSDNNSNIAKAINLVYKATGEDRNYVMVEYIPDPGTYVDGSKYYVFSMSARDGSFVSDVSYVVDKNTFKVYTCTPYGEIQPMENESVNKKEENTQSSKSKDIAINSNQIPGAISCKDAFNIISKGYAPTYEYTGFPDGEISYEMYNTVEKKEEASYVFGFINVETGDKYVGWVYGDGDYMMRIVHE